MPSWYIENHLGLYSPILLKSIRQNGSECETMPTVYDHKCIEQTCAKMTVLKINSPAEATKVKGYVTNGSARIPVDLMESNVLYLQSCFDLLHLFVYFVDAANGGVLRVFSCKVAACGRWGVLDVKAHEVGFFGDKSFVVENDEYLTIQLEVEEMRTKQYHYRIDCDDRRVDNRPICSGFSMLFYGRLYSLVEFRCPFCQVKHGNLSHLKMHINHQHLYFRAEIEEKTVKIVKNETETETSREFTFVSRMYRGRNAQIIGKRNMRHYKFIKVDEKEFRGRIYEIYHYSEYLVRVLKYGLEHRMLIEKESLTGGKVNEALAIHLNSRMGDYKMREEERRIMEEWNRLRIEGRGALEAAYEVLGLFGVTEEVLGLLEILYTQGVVTSLDLMQALNRYEAKKETTGDKKVFVHSDTRAS